MTEIVDAQVEHTTALAIRRESAQESVLALPVKDMLPVLQEFADRRAAFKKWLLAQFVEGKHYGFPPGCEARYSADGQLLVHTKTGDVPYPLTQWRPSPMLFKKGVKLACDLFNLVALIEYDEQTHSMYGKTAGTICLKCSIYHKRDSERKHVLGTGRGVAERSTTQRNDPHAALLKAETRAERDALYDAMPILADLFGSEAKDGDEPDTNGGPKTNGDPKSDTPIGPTDRKMFFNQVKAYIAKRKVADALDVVALVGIVVNDLLQKPKAETLKELAEVQQAITSGAYDLTTGDRIPDNLGGDEPPEPGSNG